MDEFVKVNKNVHRQIKDWSSKLRSLMCMATKITDNVQSLIESCVNETFRLRNLDIDQAEVSVRAMEQGFSVPRESIKYAPKKDAVWTNVRKKKRKTTFDKGEANTRVPITG